MFALLRKFDAVAQRVVDSAAFFLMRRFGWPKSFLQYGVGAIGIMAVVTGLSVLTGNFGFHPIVLAVAAVVGFFLWRLHANYRQNAGDEDRATIISANDASQLPVLPIVKIIWYGLLIKNVITTFIGPHAAEVARLFFFTQYCLLVWDTAFLLEAYLIKTPKTPPPKKEKKKVAVLTPAPVSAR